MSQAATNTYDEVPYLSVPLPATHPNRLATLAALFGLHTAPVEHCRVLELGCATGGNLIPMAYTLPHSTFVGIDLSPRQIAQGQAMIDALELTNITLQALDVLDIEANFGTFDYIIAYGIYSWVPPAVQERILTVCKRHLAPDGVAFVSYNTYPGWHMRAAVREMLLYHSQHFAGIQQRTEQSWGLLSFLVDATATLSKHVSGIDTYHQMLQQERELLRDKPEFYLIHEHLEPENHPVYFYQFVERVEREGLQYLGDARISTMLSSTLPPDIAQTIETVAPHAIAVEQYMDFLLNRTFRQSMLCHNAILLQRDLRPERLTSFQFAAPAQPVGPDDPSYLPDVAKFRAPGGSVVSLRSALTNTALRHLIDIWPQALPFDELLTVARERVAREGEPQSDDAEMLANTLLRCYILDLVELRMHTPLFTLEAGKQPVASHLARLQVQSNTTVTNMCHEQVELDPISAHLLPALDGSRDRTALIELLEQAFATGNMIQEDGATLSEDATQRRQMLEALLDRCLDMLARAALIMR